MPSPLVGEGKGEGDGKDIRLSGYQDIRNEIKNLDIEICSNFYIIFRIEEFFGCKQMEADANGWGRI